MHTRIWVAHLRFELLRSDDRYTGSFEEDDSAANCVRRFPLCEPLLWLAKRLSKAVRTATTASILVVAAACSPSDDDYAAAIERNWPNEQRAQLDRAAFLANHARSFERGAALAADNARILGTDNDLSAGAERTAKNARAEQEEAEYIAAAKFVSARDISCAPASPLPGHNCEATITILGPDDKEHDLPGAWRFDELDGQVEVVGAMGN